MIWRKKCCCKCLQTNREPPPEKIKIINKKVKIKKKLKNIKKLEKRYSYQIIN